MNENNSPKKTILILLFSIAIFFLTSFLLKWHMVIAGLLSIGSYVGLSLVTADVEKIGSTPVDKLSSGETLKQALDEAELKVNNIGKISRTIKDKEINEMGLELYNIGVQIIDYLKQNPGKISKSLYFLSYDVDTALRILDNYKTLSLNVSKEKLVEVEKNSEKSLSILVTNFKSHRDSFYQSKIEDIRLDTDILTKTLEMQEIEKKREDIKTETDKNFVKTYLNSIDETGGMNESK